MQLARFQRSKRHRGELWMTGIAHHRKSCPCQPRSRAFKRTPEQTLGIKGQYCQALGDAVEPSCFGAVAVFKLRQFLHQRQVGRQRCLAKLARGRFPARIAAPDQAEYLTRERNEHSSPAAPEGDAGFCSVRGRDENVSCAEI